MQDRVFIDTNMKRNLYDWAVKSVDELLPLVDDNTPMSWSIAAAFAVGGSAALVYANC